MESLKSSKEKKFRSNSLNIQRISVRRKSSFNEVRNRFEKCCLLNENNRNSDSFLKIKNDKQIDVHSNSDSTNCSLKQRDNNCGQHSTTILNQSKELNVLSDSSKDSLKVDSHQISGLTNDRRRHQSVSNSRPLVKSKIIFFENKSNNDIIDKKKSHFIRNMTKDTKSLDNDSNNYRNSDKTQNSCELKDDFIRDKESFDGIPSFEFNFTNNDINLKANDNSCNSVIELENSEPNYGRSLSICSNTSKGSDFVYFDNEPEVVFRKPQSISSDILTVKPIPKQRKSLANNEHDKTDHVNKRLDKNIHSKNESEKSIPIKECTKRESKRISALSEDSGISDVSQNSYLWQTNKTPNKIFGSKQNQEISQNEENFYYNSDEQNEQIYEHIYEELSNCRSLSPSEWIDIESEDKQNIRIEVIVNRRSQHLRPNINYRKSFRPKIHKRKSNRNNCNNNVIKLIANETNDSFNSGSATEYEDIEDDDYNIDQSIDHLKRIKSQINETNLVTQTSDKLQKQNSGQTSSLKESNTQLECQSNIYTSTPQRIQRFQSKYNKRESVMSRNSSIYINPENCQTNYHKNQVISPQTVPLNTVDFSRMKSESFQKQNSITGSIASYLEFNTYPVDKSSPFKTEPLYQFYQKDVRRRAELWMHFNLSINTNLEYDDYENNTIYGTTGDNTQKQTTPTNDENQLSLNSIQSLCKRNLSAMDLVVSGPNRSLWCQLPQVINSKDNLLATLSDKEKRLQESMFEIITSEASYCKSLNILVSHFHNCIDFSENNSQVLTQREKKCLFSNIIEISKISSNLLTELEKRFEQNILLYDVCDIIFDYAINHFQPYIHYCSYQRDQEKLLTQLTKTRSPFVEVLQRLESNQICQNQTLLSFLMLPMQRITRYPLLIDAVCQQLSAGSPIFDSSRRSLGFVNQLVRKCNEETKKVQRMQELIEIEKILHFRSKIKSYPIVSGARYLVKKGSVLRFSPQISAKRTIGKSIKWTKSSIYLFLFSDLLILAKKKSENNYSVFDYCSRNTVQLISLTNNGEGVGLNFRIVIPNNYTNLAQLILLHNHESKSVEYTIRFDLESEKLRWIEAVSQPLSDNPNEVLYEEWDCPQVQCIKSYCAQQTDEISLEETDVLNICRKMKDGWFEGQRIRDGLKGWFPSDYTEEIVNQHVRARNMRLRHRLLMYTQSVIDEQNN